jgi:siroheme synthase-like protein
MPPYPITLDLTARPVLVVGLGPVGRRRARALAGAGARVLAVDPDPGGAPGPLPDPVEVRAEPYDPAHLEGRALAFAAATPEVNRRVVEDARRLGVWVESASEPDSGDFAVPAAWRDGRVLLAVSTGGASPSLAARLRDRAAEALGPGAAILAEALAEARPHVAAAFPEPARRRRVLADLARPEWLDLARSGGPEAVRAAVREALRGAGVEPPSP